MLSYCPPGFDVNTGIILRNDRRVPTNGLQAICADNDRLSFIDMPGPPIWMWPVWFGVATDWNFLFPTLTEPDPRPVHLFTGAQTTYGSGQVVPLVFGKVRIGGHVIQSHLDPKYNLYPSSEADTTYVAESEVDPYVPCALNTLVLYGLGPYESITSVELDGNPSTNIPGLNYEVKLGSQYQRPTSFFPEGTKNTQTEGLGDIITKAAPGAVTNQTDQEVTQIGIRIHFASGLCNLDDRGKVKSHEVDFRYRYRPAGGSWSSYVNFTAAGCTMEPVSYWILTPTLEKDVYDVEIERLTDDNDPPDASISDEATFHSFINIITGNFAFPGFALVGFRQIPQDRQPTPRNYTALIEGVNNIRVYSTTTSYTKQWTDNPVWIGLHWICNGYYGLGQFFDYDDVEDMQEFLDAADWCDELVDDGNGGTEKRCTFNYALDRKTSAQDFLKTIATSCGVWFVEQAGKWRVVTDGTGDMVQVFNESSYEKGSLHWTYESTTSRATRLSGNFYNENHSYDKDTIVIADPDTVAGQHYVSDTVAMYGATRAGQVIRRLSQMVQANRLARKKIQFVTGVQGMSLRAGDIFGVSTRHTGVGVGNGRLASVTPTQKQLCLDQFVSLTASSTYDITICHHVDQSVETQTFTASETEDTRVITLPDDTEWTTRPAIGDVYAIGATSYSVQKYRCTRVVIQPNYRVQIFGVEYDENVYTVTYTNETEDIEYRYEADPRPPEAVADLTGDSYYVSYTAGGYQRVNTMSWTAPTNIPAVVYRIYVRAEDTTAWREAGSCTTTRFSDYVNIADTGDYEYCVVSVSQYGQRLGIDDSSTVTISPLL